MHEFSDHKLLISKNLVDRGYVHFFEYGIKLKILFEIKQPLSVERFSIVPGVFSIGKLQFEDDFQIPALFSKVVLDKIHNC